MKNNRWPVGRSSWLVILLTTLVTLSSGRAQQLINVDFGVATVSAKSGPAGYGQTPTDFWNLYSRDDGRGGYRRFGVITNLQAADRSFTGASLSVSNAPGAWGTDSPDPMFLVYLYPLGGGRNITVTLTNLAPGAYDFYLYGRGAAVSEFSTFQLSNGRGIYGPRSTASGSDWNVIPLVEDRHYVVLRKVQVLAGLPVVITVAPGGSLACLNGLQIVRTCEVTVTSPPGNQLVSPGEAVTFSVAAAAPGPVTYQWRFAGADIAGATGSNLTFVASSLTQTGVYSVRVSTARCAEEVSASLGFKTKSPNLWNVDFGEGGLKTGHAATGQSEADAWNRYVYPGQARVVIPNLRAADGRLTTVGMTVGNATAGGNNFAPDPMFDSYVSAAPGSGPVSVVLTNLPAGVYDFYCYGHGGPANDPFNSAFELVSGAASQGRKSTTTAADWASPAWQEGAQYVVFRDVVVAAEARTVTITVSGEGQPQAALSGLQFVQRNGLALDERLLSQTVVVGAPATFSVSARSELPVTFQWQFGGADIPGATNSTYTVPATSLEQAGAYSVKVSNGAYTLTSTAFMNFNVLGLSMLPGLTLDAPVGSHWEIQYVETTGSLGTWITLTNLLLPARPYLFVDTTATNSAKRFYRAINSP